MIKTLSLVAVLVASAMGSIGTILIKKALPRHSFFRIWNSTAAWAALGLYLFSVGLYLWALRYEELSVLYPFVSTSYIWITILSVIHLHEKMNVWKWISITGIIIGVILIGVGS